MARHISICPGGVLIPAALCGLCLQPARGLASIDDVPYCHEGKSPTCYERASAEGRHSLSEVIDEFIFRDPYATTRIPLD